MSEKRSYLFTFVLSVFMIIGGIALGITINLSPIEPQAQIDKTPQPFTVTCICPKTTETKSEDPAVLINRIVKLEQDNTNFHKEMKIMWPAWSASRGLTLIADANTSAIDSIQKQLDKLKRRLNTTQRFLNTQTPNILTIQRSKQ